MQNIQLHHWLKLKQRIDMFRVEQTLQLWNSLPDPVKQIESRERFVAELGRRYLDRIIVAGDGKF
ncbi:hypothetical protein J6590_084314 [Homalodisca vitripennis]|nr:hypothetical protein J6590_084314 [Homalodisca vitripennis]